MTSFLVVGGRRRSPIAARRKQAVWSRQSAPLPLLLDAQVVPPHGIAQLIVVHSDADVIGPGGARMCHLVVLPKGRDGERRALMPIIDAAEALSSAELGAPNWSAEER